MVEPLAAGLVTAVYFVFALRSDATISIAVLPLKTFSPMVNEALVLLAVVAVVAVVAVAALPLILTSKVFPQAFGTPFSK